MSNRPLLDSQKKHRLEKLIRSNKLSAEQTRIVEYLKLRFSTAMTRWLSGVEQADPERLRGEAACLKDLIQILSDTQVEYIEGDNDGRTN